MTTHRLAFGLTLFVAASAHAAAPPMKEGLWEMVAKTESAGAATDVTSQTVQRCMSAKDLQDPRKTAPDNAGTAMCEVSNYRLQANTATWDVACRGTEPMRGTGTVTYQDDRYTGVNHMSSSRAAQATKITMNYAGRYLGPCRPGKK